MSTNDTIREAGIAQDRASRSQAGCAHRIADARNKHVASGYVCLDCGSVFAAADHSSQAGEVAEQAPASRAVGELSNVQLYHLWDTHVGDPTPSRPLNDMDKIAFARAVLYAIRAATPSAPVSEPAGAASPDVAKLHELANEALRLTTNAFGMEKACAAIVALNDAAIDALAKLSEGACAPVAEMERNWISVNDRLPENRHLVLAYRPDADESPACDPNNRLCSFDGERWDGAHRVTHWMPLPAAPTQEAAE